MPFVRRTRHTLRRAELGFFGVVVYTRTHTPRFCGHALRAGDAVLKRAASRPCRMSWLMVGIEEVFGCRTHLGQGPGRGGADFTYGRPSVKHATAGEGLRRKT